MLPKLRGGGRSFMIFGTEDQKESISEITNTQYLHSS